MGKKLINAHGLNFLLFCGHDLPNNGHYLRVSAFYMAIEKEKKTRFNGPINFQFITWFIIKSHFMLFHWMVFKLMAIIIVFNCFLMGSHAYHYFFLNKD